MRDVGMIERSQALGLPLESSQAARVMREALWKYLQRHVALQLGVAGPIHFTHPALTEGAENLVGPELVTRREGQHGSDYFTPLHPPPFVPKEFQSAHNSDSR